MATGEAGSDIAMKAAGVPIALLAALLFIGLPTPAELTDSLNDAPHGLSSASIEEGTHNGTLEGVQDYRDVYHLDVGELAILRLDLDAAEPVRVKLYDPDGELVACVHDQRQAHADLVPHPLGTWEIHVDYGGSCSLHHERLPFVFEDPAPDPVAYDLSIELQERDHWQRVETDAQNLHAWNMTPEPDQKVFMHLRIGVDGEPPSRWTVAGQRVDEENRAPETSLAAFAVHEWLPSHPPSAWLAGPFGPEARVDPPYGSPMTGDMHGIKEMSGEGLEGFDFGVAQNVQMQVDGWVAWNEGPAPLETLDGGSAEFLRMRDLQPEGAAFQAGWFVHADELECALETGSSLNFVFVDAREPRPFLFAGEPSLTLQDPSFVLERPHASTVELDDQYFAAAGAGAPPGAWTLTVEDASGPWGEKVVCGSVSFPFPPLEYE